ncbi:hypothetical protein LCGC14_0413510 [marine sediment metagenome]|uniref:Uncharacterized protein n=1 Tax=marine sediment metagenome TaxID=412755 RepID=A0A0F9SZ16_9ZZZZ
MSVPERIVICETSRTPDGVRYSVCREVRGKRTQLWTKWVPFAHRRGHNAGGTAFVEAAREQEHVAKFEGKKG